MSLLYILSKFSSLFKKDVKANTTFMNIHEKKLGECLICNEGRTSWYVGGNWIYEYNFISNNKEFMSMIWLVIVKNLYIY